jgi:hypothetical protein
MVHNICRKKVYMSKLKLIVSSQVQSCNQAPKDIHHIFACQKRGSLSRSRFSQEIQQSQVRSISLRSYTSDT